MARSNAQQQWWDAERRPAQEPRGRSLRRHDRRVRPQRWTEAVETLQELQEQKREVFSEANAEGFDVKILKEIIKLRKQDKDERDEREALLDLLYEGYRDGGARTDR